MIPEGLPQVLFFLGLACLAASAIQFALTPLMGLRMAANVRWACPRHASWWTKERAERMSKIGAVCFAALGLVLLAAGGVLFVLNGARW
ncbi:hypothetical protein [Homoserinibacter sp. GY 40078]|uniref:hypothetical protein n=1 Tax=Homoserinibacter sp. GY 40078 TaxID=2603275 RepID=UPI0011C96A37|nr:hypothetical protein [Homoserinibacter sp. GY 40078]TXK18764.1 hypothetical protein FVQ89_02140 [Homoserinibacter sp. GY 40078]